MGALITGLLAGFIHVITGPDHLAAVAPSATDARSRAWRVGLQWGVGHTAGVLLIVALSLLFKRALPLEQLSMWSETAVGVALVTIGLWALRKALRQRVHYHEHDHGDHVHAHFHVHAAQGAHEHAQSHRHRHLPLGLGALHGVAGASHLIAVLPAILMPGISDAAFYLVGYAAGSIGAMAVFTVALERVSRRWTRRHANAHAFITGALAIVAIGVGVAWLVVARA